MIIYNVTINVEPEIIQDWISWMKSTHIPEVMETGCFYEHNFLKLHHEPENNGETFAVQYIAKNWELLNDYLETHAGKLRERSQKRFPNKTLAFRTVLESMD